MTAKEKIKEIYPRSYAEKYKTNGFGKDKTTYYLIWSSRLLEERHRLGEGNTESQAWKDALTWIENKNE